MKNKFILYLYIFLFLTGISLPATVMLFSKQEEEKESLKILSSDTLSLKNFPKAFNTYFDNEFALRKPLIVGFSLFRVFVLQENSINEKVIYGKDGWFFYGPASDGYGMEDFIGETKLSEEDLLKLKGNILVQSKWLKKRGIKYLVVVCPNKQSIYPEYLPSSIKKGESVLDQMAKFLNESEVPILDLRPALLASKNKTKNYLYYKTDTHWNKLGAYYGYQTIMENLRNMGVLVRPDSSENFKIKSIPSKGRDIAQMIGIDSFLDDNSFDLSQNVVKNSGGKKPSLVIFSDSYFINLNGFMAQHFDTIVSRPHFWNSFDYKVIEETKPDIVIYQMVERYSKQLLRDNPDYILKE